MARSCEKCDRPLKGGAHFCGACGARQVAPAEDAESVARYRSVAENFGSQGGVDARELQQLETLRQRLDLSVATHELILAQLEVSAPPAATVRLSVDVSTIRHFEVDARCMLRLQLHNDGDLAIEKLQLFASVFGEQDLPIQDTETIFPNHAAVTTLWLEPKVAGFQELRGALHTVDLMGVHHFYHFDSVLFRVGSTGDGTRISVVNIDQRSARVVDNSRSQLTPSDSAGGLVADGEWQPVPLRQMTPDQAGQLVTAWADIAAKLAEEARADKPESHSAAQPRSVDFVVDTDADKYQASSAIAQGDLATVYRGRRVSDGAPVALKVADDAGDNDLMQAEVRALKLLRADPSRQLKHLPVVLDQFRTSDGRLGTAFEQLDGHDLLTIRQKFPDGLPAHHIVWILRRCLSVLGLVHSCGIIHGNIDPAHIIVRANDHNVWLIDWCYSIVDPAKSGQGFRCLNETYSPPEVEARKPPLPSSDLYSLGKCMIFAAGGDPDQKTLPDTMDDRLQRFIKFFVLDSALGRARDAWKLYRQLDSLREDIFGPHKFMELKI